MSKRDDDRNPQAATCESCSEDEQEPRLDATASANVTFKRSKPELATRRSYERHRKGGSDSGYSSKTGATTDSKDSRRKGPRPLPPPIDTNPAFHDRERRPTTSPERPMSSRRSSSHPVAQRTGSVSSTQENPYKDYKHDTGQCWVCDKYGKHVELSTHENTHLTPIPPSPQSARHHSGQLAYAESGARPQPRARGSSYRSERQPSYFPGMALETSHPAAPHSRTDSFGHSGTQPMSPAYAAPLTPIMTSYTPVAYSYTPVITTPQYTYPVEPHSQCYQPPPASHARPAQKDRRASMHDNSHRPIIQQSLVERPALLLERTTSNREDHHSRSREHSTASRSRKANYDEDSDRMAMPPPPRRGDSQLVLAHRPSIRKSATTTNTPRVSSRSFQYHDDEYIRDDQAQVSVRPPLPRVGRSEIPPSAYREHRGNTDRSPTKNKASCDNPTRLTETISSRSRSPAPPMPRRATVAITERHEIEAEAYQRRLSTGPALTDDALRKLSKHTHTPSTTSSSQRSRNSSSKESSGTKKTGRSTGEGINLMINGMTLGISGEDAKNHTLNITAQKDGAVNISVGGNKAESNELVAKSVQRTPSTTSKASRSTRGTFGSEVDGERDRDRDKRFARDDPISARESRRSSRSGLGSWAGRRPSTNDRDYFVYGA